jgi:hypothetical protein
VLEGGDIREQGMGWVKGMIIEPAGKIRAR